jgi:hypothetical protein
VATRYAPVRQHRGAVFSSSSTIRKLLRSRATVWSVAVLVGLFALAGVLYAVARLTG